MDQSKYIQLLESKYKRALKIIENAHSENQELQSTNNQLAQQAQTASLSLEAFKQRSIQEYQALREQLEKSKGEEIIAELSKISGERQRWSELIKR